MDTQGGSEGFQYNAGTQLPTQPAVQPPAAPQVDQKIDTQDDQIIQWNASEFMDNHKSLGWFALLGVGTLVVCGLIFLMTRSIFSSVVVLVAAVAFGIFARQKPRTLSYSLLPTTLKIGEKSYSYDDFRSFSIKQEGALYSVLLQPVKRFMPYITIYFPADDGERIFDALAVHLPHEERKDDPIDGLMRKIRF